MSFFGVGLNRTSLAGFIIAMGMLVDNAIVVTDNAQIAIARGVDRRKALIDGATGPQWGMLGATFIAICSFLPLYLAPSAVAEIVKPLFVVLAISLGLSWVLALTQTTVFGNFILKAKAKDGAKDPYDKPFYHKIRFYPPYADSQENVDTRFDGSAFCCFIDYHGGRCLKTSSLLWTSLISGRTCSIQTGIASMMW